jgi:hypothetical protein
VPALADERVLVPAAEPRNAVSFGYRYAYVLRRSGGDTRAAAARLSRTVRAFPYLHGDAGFHGKATHASTSNEYAVDIRNAHRTGVYAARDGIVVEIAYSNYAGARNLEIDGPRANIVRILHEDGTFRALCASRSRVSVVCAPATRVREGQYIADSGNTGFTTGPTCTSPCSGIAGSSWSPCRSASRVRRARPWNRCRARRSRRGRERPSQACAAAFPR